MYFLVSFQTYLERITSDVIFLFLKRRKILRALLIRHENWMLNCDVDVFWTFLSIILMDCFIMHYPWINTLSRCQICLNNWHEGKESGKSRIFLFFLSRFFLDGNDCHVYEAWQAEGSEQKVERPKTGENVFEKPPSWHIEFIILW